jgi:hypothetical protein
METNKINMEPENIIPHDDAQEFADSDAKVKLPSLHICNKNALSPNEKAENDLDNKLANMIKDTRVSYSYSGGELMQEETTYESFGGASNKIVPANTQKNPADERVASNVTR